MSRVDDIIEAYEAWDPEEESATELAERIGISKARLYQVLDREGITPKARRPRRGEDPLRSVVAAAISGPLPTNDDQLEEMVGQAFDSLLRRIRELRMEVAEYRRRFGPLD